VAVDYFSPRLLCRFDLALRAISIRRRIASEREGLLMANRTPGPPPFSSMNSSRRQRAFQVLKNEKQPHAK
jgi:hypothetical protein